MDAGSGAMGGPVCGILLILSCGSPVGGCPTGVVYPKFTFRFCSIGELRLEYIICYSVRGRGWYTGDFNVYTSKSLWCVLYVL